MGKLKNKFRWRDIVFIALLIKIIYWLFRWGKHNPGKKGFKIDEKLEADFLPGQLIIMRKEGVTKAQFEQWKQENLRSLNIEFVKVCGNCDNSLELWKGDNVLVFIQGVEKIASGGQSSGSTVEGGGETPIAYFCLNFIVNTPESFLDECERDKYNFEEGRIEPPPPATGALVTIGILDTGVLSAIKNEYTKPVTGSCIDNGEKGWNFVDKNAITTDDNDIRHGSLVAKFVIDQALKYRNHPINILPVKVHDSEGKSDLFSILCGLAYASSCGAQVINASFGFYAKQKSGAPSLLQTFVEKHLVAKNILLIAAAGNQNVVEDSDFLAYSTGNPRDLDVHPFYPASFAAQFEHVLAATTVRITAKSASSSPEQNFSDNAVEMGVICDETDSGGHFSFRHPFGEQVLIYGSSYAAPILTGIIAQHYTELLNAMPGGQFDKTLLLQKLRSLLLTGTNGKLASFVKDGTSCKK
ncbi:MAG: S8/S53 family peptidase [Williamsia sp.]|nr:S8/S53 family peptidase [Williamsia sp.]